MHGGRGCREVWAGVQGAQGVQGGTERQGAVSSRCVSVWAWAWACVCVCVCVCVCGQVEAALRERAADLGARAGLIADRLASERRLLSDLTAKVHHELHAGAGAPAGPAAAAGEPGGGGGSGGVGGGGGGGGGSGGEGAAAAAAEALACMRQMARKASEFGRSLEADVNELRAHLAEPAACRCLPSSLPTLASLVSPLPPCRLSAVRRLSPSAPLPRVSPPLSPPRPLAVSRLSLASPPIRLGRAPLPRASAPPVTVDHTHPSFARLCPLSPCPRSDLPTQFLLPPRNASSPTFRARARTRKCVCARKGEGEGGVGKGVESSPGEGPGEGPPSPGQTWSNLPLVKRGRLLRQRSPSPPHVEGAWA